MNELPHYFGLDFTGAGSWIIVGFLAGFFLSWLWRALRGSRLDAKAQAKIHEIEALLDTSRSEHQSDVARLLGDARNFEQALADAERRAAAHAAKVSQLTGDLDRLTKAELNSRNELLAADSEMAKLKSSLQWADTQSRNATQERSALQQQLNSFLGERQTLAADLATVRTAGELKDAEIARLINQVQWYENRASFLEQEKLGLTSHLGTLSTKDTEIARLTSELAAAQAHATRIAGELSGANAELSRTKGELGSVQMSLANLQSNASSGADSLSLMQTRYDQTWKDLTYMRNLAYWQASEIDRLRKAIGAFEADIAGKSATLATLTQQFTALKAKAASGTRARPGAIRISGRAGSGETPASGKFSFLHRHGKATPKALRKAYKLKASAIAGNAGASPAKRGNGYGHPLMVLGKSSATQRAPTDELASLKAQLATLSEDAGRYRRLRDAVHQANRIADEEA
jgi:chromosome segregation ATPase